MELFQKELGVTWQLQQNNLVNVQQGDDSDSKRQQATTGLTPEVSLFLQAMQHMGRVIGRFNILDQIPGVQPGNGHKGARKVLDEEAGE